MLIFIFCFLSISAQIFIVSFYTYWVYFWRWLISSLIFSLFFKRSIKVLFWELLLLDKEKQPGLGLPPT